VPERTPWCVSPGPSSFLNGTQITRIHSRLAETIPFRTRCYDVRNAPTLPDSTVHNARNATIATRTMFQT
jgi:hypothetical protein